MLHVLDDPILEGRLVTAAAAATTTAAATAAATTATAGAAATARHHAARVHAALILATHERILPIRHLARLDHLRDDDARDEARAFFDVTGDQLAELTVRHADGDADH